MKMTDVFEGLGLVCYQAIEGYYPCVKAPSTKSDTGCV